jgi:hypothetical protein
VKRCIYGSPRCNSAKICIRAISFLLNREDSVNSIPWKQLAARMYSVVVYEIRCLAVDDRGSTISTDLTNLKALEGTR